MSRTCPECATTWRTDAELVAAFTTMAQTLLNHELWPRTATPMVADVTSCPSCLVEWVTP